MNTQSTNVLFALVMLDSEKTVPLYKQLYDGLREAILSGKLVVGSRLPSTRQFAQSMGISRSTVLNAFDLLLQEGYIEGRIGSGSYIAKDLPDDLLRARGHQLEHEQARTGRQLSLRGQRVARTPVAAVKDWDEPLTGAFRTGVPALDAFPFEIWTRLLHQRWKRPPHELLGYTDPAGYRPLRAEIAAYARVSRGVNCEADQVIIVAGSQQALNLAARLLLDPGDAAWIEEPIYMGAQAALISEGAEIVSVPVDQEGLNVNEGIARCREARLAYVTPSHQFPLGVTMSLARRLALLRWAEEAGAWILEDDYDSEYRYTGRPLSSLQGLDQQGRVIYIGTFSKVLFPGIRLGYLIVPADLVEAFANARGSMDRHSPILEQLVLTDFITQEHFARHIRRMRTLYKERQEILLEAAAGLRGLLDLQPAEAGMHLVARLPEGLCDTDIRQKAASRQVSVAPLSLYYQQEPYEQGLLLGYTSVPEQEIRPAVKRLGWVLEESLKKQR